MICRLKAIGAWRVVAAALLLCLVPLSGCDTQEKISDRKTSLGKAAEEYWTARFINKDYRATYEMELVKETLPFEQYMERVRNAGQIAYKSIRIDTVHIEDGKGVVDLIVTCKMPNAPADMELPVKDVWNLESNQWKHVLTKRESGNLPLLDPSSLLGR